MLLGYSLTALVLYLPLSCHPLVASTPRLPFLVFSLPFVNYEMLSWSWLRILSLCISLSFRPSLSALKRKVCAESSSRLKLDTVVLKFTSYSTCLFLFVACLVQWENVLIRVFKFPPDKLFGVRSGGWDIVLLKCIVYSVSLRLCISLFVAYLV